MSTAPAGVGSGAHPDPAAAGPGWGGELRGALNATAATLPFVLSFGFIVFGAIGAGAAQIGLSAALVGVVIGGLVFIALARVALPCASPSATSSLLLGAAVVQWLRDPGLHPATGSVTLLLAATSATVLLAGAFYLLLGAVRAGSLVRFVPQPVLAGFLNGVAILIVVSQLAPLLGLAPDAFARLGSAAWAGWQWPALATAGLTALLMAALGRFTPRLPAALAALVLASVLAVSVQAASGGALQLSAIGPLHADWPRPVALLPLLGGDGVVLLAAHGRTIVVTAALLALVGALESVLNLMAVDQQSDQRSDPNRVLLALGGANIASAVFGGLPLVYLRLRAVATLKGGGRGWRSALLGCLALAALFALALPLLQRIPTAVVAGVVVMLAWTLVDPWTGRLLVQAWRGEHSVDRNLSLGVIAAVFATTALAGFASGVALGVLLAMVIFIRALQRSLVRLRCTAVEVPSRRVYPAPLEQALRPLRARIELIELEGALFFGNAQRLLQEAEELPPGAAFLVLDLRRVSSIDASGAFALGALSERLHRQGVSLLLAGVDLANRHGMALRAHGLLAPGTAGPILMPDADHAIEHAERQLLLRAGTPLETLEMALEDCALLQGLDAPARAVLAAVLQQRQLAPGERLFAQGEAGDALYILSAGSVSVLDRERGQRFVSFSPGMSFGETAVLDGGGRTADAVADQPSTVHALSAAAMAELQRQHPALAAQIYRNLALHLSERLRSAARAWRRAAG
jgi:SulP family sulfate permease